MCDYYTLGKLNLALRHHFFELGKFKICHEQLINQNEYVFLTQFLGCYVSITLPDVIFGEIILVQLCRY